MMNVDKRLGNSLPASMTKNKTDMFGIESLSKQDQLGKFNGKSAAQVLRVDQKHVDDLTKTIT